MREGKTKVWAIVAIVLVGISIASALLMGFWNLFLSQVTGVSPISYLTALAGGAFGLSILASFWWIKAIWDFIVITISMAMARRSAKKVEDSASEILRHFDMFKNGTTQP